MDNLNIALVFMNYCKEQYKPLHIWGDEIDEDWDNEFSGNFRLVFKASKGRHPNCELRSEVYVEVSIDGTVVSLQNERRELIIVNLTNPDSLDKVDEFISKRSTSRISSRIRSSRYSTSNS